MKHLFIINPVAKGIKEKTKKIKDMIHLFFKEYPDLHYDIFESRWCRDSLTFIRRYISNKDEVFRIHSIGGNGTLYEVINSTVGLTNVEIAAHPYGSANAFLRYFGSKNLKYFLSLKCQVFDKTIPLDIIRCGNNYGIGSAFTGLEAYANIKGDQLILKGMPEDLAYVFATIVRVLKGKANQKYFMEIDGEKLDGEYISILTSNSPCYGKDMYPASDAHPDNGILDVYVIKNVSRFKILTGVPVYLRGDYKKIPELVTHYRAKKIKLSSDEVMFMS
ncbi:MAG: hypothetical protein FWD24_01925, partial [Treponema sp.]|nr:hypothetical protein [Treponema sp.]